ncbi:hypothetical protein GCM10011586_29200 [Silvibacterium dinghuense]|nr:hypothetical protein GCM10011586_29200 [Silvibacterium dinghuense]
MQGPDLKSHPVFCFGSIYLILREIHLPKRNQDELLEQLKSTFKASVPSGSIIAMQAIEAAIKGKSPRWIKGNFSGLVQSIQSDAYDRYLVYEKKGWEKAFRKVFGPTLKDCSSPEQVADLMIENFYVFDKFFLSLTQGRRI